MKVSRRTWIEAAPGVPAAAVLGKMGLDRLRRGRQLEGLSPAAAVALGIDANHAHTQGRGLYHYHGLPTGLLWALRAAGPRRPLHLLGYAADGFPIYGPDGPSAADDLQSPSRRL